MEAKAFRGGNRKALDPQGLIGTSRDSDQADGQVRRGLQESPPHSRHGSAELGRRQWALSYRGAGVDKVSWRIWVVVFIMGIVMWAGGAVYAIHQRGVTVDQNCQAVKQLRTDLVRVLRLYRKNAQSTSVHDQAIAIVRRAHCEK